MPSYHAPVGLTGVVGDLRRDTRHLAVRKHRTFLFTLSGPVAVTSSPGDAADFDTTLVEVRCLLGTAGSSSTVVTVYVNGTSVGTVTLTSSTTNASVTFATALTADTDILTVGVTTAGTGAKDLTVLGRTA